MPKKHVQALAPPDDVVDSLAARRRRFGSDADHHKLPLQALQSGYPLALGPINEINTCPDGQSDHRIDIGSCAREEFDALPNPPLEVASADSRWGHDLELSLGTQNHIQTTSVPEGSHHAVG
jgi:hypothetical protein